MKPLRLLLLLAPLTLLAEGEAELRDAVAALSRNSYRWETTVRQRFTGETTEPRIDPNAPLEVEGRATPDGLAEITLAPSRELAAPVTMVFRFGDVVARTPVGWLRRSEMRQTPDANRTVDFEGRQVRLSRFFTVATKATARRPLAEELFDVIADVKSWRLVNGLVLAELREKTIEQLWGDAQARRAPEVHGTLVFKLGEDGLAECHVVLGIGFPDAKTNAVAWTMQQWTTRVSGIGTTKVDPPAAALEALDK